MDHEGRVARRLAGRRFRLWVLLLLCTSGMLVAQRLPAAAQPTDAVLVIDSSGSMKRTDPRRLRVPAARLFARLLGPGDRIGVISFSDAGYPVVHLTPNDAAHRARIEAGIGKVSAKGAYTNLRAAVQAARTMLEREGDPSHQRLVLLLSDGHMDTGDAKRDARLVEALFSEELPRLKRDGIRLHTIAFTEASDLELLARMAHATGGITRLASNDRALHQVFGALFETAKQPDMLPIEHGEFLVDDAVGEFTVVASKARPDVRIVLEMPDGRRIAAVNAGRAVHWFQSDTFDMITVEGPPPGTWRLLAADPAGGNRAYVVTDLGLHAEITPTSPRQGDTLTVRAWLTRGQARLTRPEVLAATGFRAEIEPEQGQGRVLPLADSGVAGDEQAGDACYANQLRLADPGAYRVRVRAESSTFRREKVLHFDVAPVPASAEAAGEGPVPDRSPAPAQPSPPQQGKPANPPAVDAAAPPDGKGAATKAAPATPAAAVEEPLLPPAALEEEETVSLWTVLGLFLALNLIIGGALGGWLLWRRRRQAGQAEKDAEDPTDLSWLDLDEEDGAPEAASAAENGGETPAEGDGGEAAEAPADAAAEAEGTGSDVQEASGEAFRRVEGDAA